ncbi:MAG: hypothetical protein LBG52_07605 [Candidatus Peribacteria bacterium]|jgi:hypothetical protein|nr:hypothetical protein [Candidatus Peribacteria bacterium]
MIASIQFPPELSILFDKILLEVWGGSTADYEKEIQIKKDKIEEIKAEKNKIAQYLLS